MASDQNAPFIVFVTNPGSDNEVVKRIQKMTDRHELAQNLWLVRSSLLVKDLTDEFGTGRSSVWHRHRVSAQRDVLGTSESEHMGLAESCRLITSPTNTRWVGSQVKYSVTTPPDLTFLSC